MKDTQKKPKLLHSLYFGIHFVAILILAPVWAPDVQAQDIFTVQGIRMDKTAASAREARAIALKESQEEAIGHLLRRLTPSSVWDELPVVESEALPFLVKGLQVTGEKTSSTRYLGWLAVSFKPPAITALLQGAGIDFVQLQSEPILLLPVYSDQYGSILWQEDNNWREAWARADIVGSLTPFVLPVGDLEDITDVSVQQALTGDVSALYNLAARYQLNRIMVAQALLFLEGGLVQVVATLYDYDGVQRTFTFTVSNKEVEVQPVFQTEESSDQLPRAMTDAGIARNNLLEEGIQQLIARSEEGWKKGLLAQDDGGGSLLVWVAYDNLREWLGIRKKIQGVASVDSFTIQEQTISGAWVVLSHLGDVSALSMALSRQNLHLVREEGGWIVFSSS
ncbi:MAG: DUF2066 domain-containing protein [Parvularculales bacterium]